MMIDLDVSASRYADHAENRVSQLQQAYLKKYQPQQYDYSANVLQRPQDDPGPSFERFGSIMRSALYDLPESWQGSGFESANAAPSKEGIADIAHEIQLVYSTSHMHQCPMMIVGKQFPSSTSFE